MAKAITNAPSPIPSNKMNLPTESTSAGCPAGRPNSRKVSPNTPMACITTASSSETRRFTGWLSEPRNHSIALQADRQGQTEPPLAAMARAHR